MATATLSVFWPDEFSVYDVRVCEQLGRFQNLGNKTDFDAIWDGYCEYLAAVRSAVPAELSLRDADRYLWAKSVAEQLDADVQVAFQRGKVAASDISEITIKHGSKPKKKIKPQHR